jgi:hypothetical protein
MFCLGSNKVGDAEPQRGRRHDLHQAARARARDGARVERGLDLDHRPTSCSSTPCSRDGFAMYGS